MDADGITAWVTTRFTNSGQRAILRQARVVGLASLQTGVCGDGVASTGGFNVSLVTFVEAVFVGVVMLAFVFAVLWSLFDIAVRARETSVAERLGWAFLVVAFNVIGAALYVSLGPGRRRWAPWGEPSFREKE